MQIDSLEIKVKSILAKENKKDYVSQFCTLVEARKIDLLEIKMKKILNKEHKKDYEKKQASQFLFNLKLNAHKK